MSGLAPEKNEEVSSVPMRWVNASRPRHRTRQSSSATVSQWLEDVLRGLAYPWEAELAASLRPTAVVMAIPNEMAAKFVPAYRAKDSATRFYAFSFLDGTALHKAIGKDATGVVISQVVPSPWSSTAPIVERYRKAMIGIGEPDFTYGNLEGFIATEVLLQAIRKTKEPLTSGNVLKTLGSFQHMDVGGLTVRYSKGQHGGLGLSELSMVKENGAYAR
jgi:branched-chain amino acid transport system substrate-binding protein